MTFGDNTDVEPVAAVIADDKVGGDAADRAPMPESHRRVAEAPGTLPAGTFRYSVSTLGAESSGPDGRIIEPASLITSDYQVEIEGDRSWIERTLTGPQAGWVQSYRGGHLLLRDADGRVVREGDFGEELVVPQDELLRGYGTHARERAGRDGAAVRADRSANGRFEWTSTGTTTQRTGAWLHYLSLPWNENGENVERQRVVETEDSGRVLHQETQLNDVTVYRFELQPS